MANSSSSSSALCGSSPFWDEQKLLNSSYPNFTQCFKNTALIWVPCGFLWVLAPMYLFYMSMHRQGPRVPLNKFNSLKTILAILLVVVSVIDLVHQAQDHSSLITAAYISGGLKIATFCLMAVLIQVECYFGLVTSAVLFLTLLLMVVSSVIPFYSNITEKENKTDMFSFTLFYIYFSLLFLEFLLHFKADRSRLGDYRKVGSKPPCPEMTASFPSQIVFFWVGSLLRSGYSKSLEENDVFELNPRDQSTTVVPVFEGEWTKARKLCEVANKRRRQESQTSFGYHRSCRTTTEQSPLLDKEDVVFASTKKGDVKLSHPSLLKVILKGFGGTLFISQILKLVADLITFVTPLLINEIIAYTQNRGSERVWKGYMLACSFFVVSMFKTCLYQYHFHISMSLGMRIKNAIISAVYKKALTISNKAKKESTVGEIVNLMSVDCQRIQDAVGYIYMLWSMPLMIIISLYLLGNLHPSMLAGLGVLILLLPINAWAANKQKNYQVQQMKVKDQRIKVMNEVLNGMKVLKLYAWEESFQQKIMDIRRQELTTLKKTAYVVAVMMFIWTCAPYMVQLVSFGTYIAVSETGYLDPATAFVSFSLFAILNQALTFLPMVIPFLIQAGVSVGRVSKFLQSEDLDPDFVQHDLNSDVAVKIENGTFTWDQSLLLPTLRDINISIPSGHLVAIVGSVGSGKSSLLSAMLGEMTKIEGSVTLKNRIAYVPQEAWILNASLKDNIIFGNNFSSSRYQKVVQACALQPDIEILPAQDETEIGEKGINLSGGQKQRVSLARAVYSRADIYLLDDPLSAVDSHVGKHIFNEVFSNKGILKNRTRVLVTHGIHWLPFVDHIVVMSDGQISEEGSYDSLMSHHGAFASFLQEFFHKQAAVDEDPEIQEMKSQVLQRLESATSVDEDGFSSDDLMSKKSIDLPQQNSLMTSVEKKEEARPVSDKLIEEEKSETGKVKYSIYLQYIRAVGWWTFLLMTSLYFLFQVTSTGSAIWLSLWTDDQLLANTSAAGSSEYIDRNNMYLAVYGVLGLAQSIFVLAFSVISTTKMVSAAGTLHNNLLINILKAPMSFFDTTPIGRIVNRFSRDVETIDNNLPASMRTFYQCIFSVLGTVVTISYSTPVFLAVILPLGVMYWLIQRFYIPTSRQLRRIESTTRSPIYVHFSETVSGAASIRAYGASHRFMQESRARVDHNLSFYFASLVANRWLGFYLEFIGNLVILAAALFAVLSADLSAGLVGLSVSYASQVTGSLNYLVRMFSDLETNIVSVERVQEYTIIPTEAVWVNPSNRPPDEWPDHGEVILQEYQMRYRPGLELALKGVTCHIQGQQKVGIVGRTGAGKSSLTVALFRLTEAASGSIIIDKKTIAQLGLHDLRSRLTILPQDPVIFSGTLRTNLDPFSEHSDSVLWSALEHAHLKVFVEKLPLGLGHECGEGGQNLSVGQRQLLCLARTLVRKTKILVLDEATAAVDMETDELIQKTIRTEFRDCTVLTIAHRLSTIMDYDRIMVMDKGLVVEFDSPQALVQNKKSLFYGMAKDAKLVS